MEIRRVFSPEVDSGKVPKIPRGEKEGETKGSPDEKKPVVRDGKGGPKNQERGKGENIDVTA